MHAAEPATVVVRNQFNVEVSFITDEEDLKVYDRFPLQHLIAGSKYAENNIIHPPTSRRLNIPAANVDYDTLMAVLHFIRACARTNPRIPKDGEKHLPIANGKPLEYYVKLLDAVIILDLKTPMAAQPRLCQKIRKHFSVPHQITKEAIGVLWAYIGNKDIGLMQNAVNKLVNHLGMEEDPTSNGAAEVVPGTSTQDFYLKYLRELEGAKELEGMINTAYEKKQKYLRAIQVRQAKSEKVLQAKERSEQKWSGADWKAMKTAYSSSGVNTVNDVQFELLKLALGRQVFRSSCPGSLKIL
ncbi:hypothetical protein EJ08DRAFT_654883 [Tothia fuscella]|uniref:Uncharacterized protein n=1 Tax=Tothia fuscella TaxID=1048955 RepID=A0A9P4NDI7_9PEZI|nr:hypothetical protein EJ08DRAFT_654883 [Tothia fuscella]